MEIMKRLFREEEGQGMIEYALIIALISIAAIASMQLIGPKIKIFFDDVSTALTKPAAG